MTASVHGDPPHLGNTAEERCNARDLTLVMLAIDEESRNINLLAFFGRVPCLERPYNCELRRTVP